MVLQDGISNIKTALAVNVATISSNTTTAGNIIDTQGYNTGSFIIFSGTITDGTYTPLIEEGDDSGLSDAAAVSDTYLLPSGTGQEAGIAFVAANDNVVKKIGYITQKRYVRLSLVSTGVTTGGTLGALSILGEPAAAPVA